MAPEVPGYEMLGLLGQGGFGVVYRARQLAVGREVALKVDNRVLVSERDRRRFMREVTAAGALSGHPHVAHVYDAGVLSDGRPFMVLELCPGGSLADRLREGTLPASQVRDIGVKIADALAAAHEAGVLHRDVKPANILVNRYGNVALSDFGLATMPSSGPDASVTRESLTPAYAPPEAFELTEPTATGDVYALAATLYALLSGRPPRFPAAGVVNLAMIMALHRQPVPDLPGVPAALNTVLRQALATEPAQRTPSAAALRDALAAISLSAAPLTAASPEENSPARDSFARGSFAQDPSPGSGGNRPYSGAQPLGSPSFAPTGGGFAPPPPPYQEPRGWSGHPHLDRPTGPGGPAHFTPTGPLPPSTDTPNRVYLAVALAFLLLLGAGVALMLIEGSP